MKTEAHVNRAKRKNTHIRKKNAIEFHLPNRNSCFSNRKFSIPNRKFLFPNRKFPNRKQFPNRKVSRTEIVSMYNTGEQKRTKRRRLCLGLRLPRRRGQAVGAITSCLVCLLMKVWGENGSFGQHKGTLAAH